jgi:hypothetical protein
LITYLIVSNLCKDQNGACSKSEQWIVRFRLAHRRLKNGGFSKQFLTGKTQPLQAVDNIFHPEIHSFNP